MDGNIVYTSNQNLVQGNDMGNVDDNNMVENKFIHFVRECQVRNTYIYREQLKNNTQRGKYFLRIEMEHLMAFDDPLVSMFRRNPAKYIKIFEEAVAIIYKNDFYDESNPELEEDPRFQV